MPSPNLQTSDLLSVAEAGSGAPESQDNPTIRKSQADCTNRTIETFLKFLQVCCSRCQPGTYQIQACSRDADTQCGPCGTDRYTEHWNTLRKCRGCEAPCSDDQDEVQPCTPTSMRVCQCVNGFHCIDLSGKTCNQCRKHTECKEGYGVVEKGTKDSDVKCERCAPGTFSDKVSSTEPCRPHTVCAAEGRKTSREGSDVEDTKCSSEFLPVPPVPKSTTPSSSLTQGTYQTKKEEPTTTVSVTKEEETSASIWVIPICVVTFILLVIAIAVCFICKRKGRMREPKAEVAEKDVCRVETVCLIAGNESNPVGVVSGDRSCGQNGGPAPLEGQVPSLLRSVSKESRGVRRKLEAEGGPKEEDQLQSHYAPLNSYSQVDCQEDQGYISRESRPSSGTPSPVIEFSGNPTVSVTINTSRYFVNCYHHPEDRSAEPGTSEEQYRAPEAEEGAEVDEGFPVQEEQRDSDSETWKEDGGSVKKDRWWCKPVLHQENGKESHLPVQDTSGKVY
ncbi:tumor necrosis factor receptor superfamily member 1B-like isoform X1 [Hypanus sabinus]|uniref:tumor necrosis factor receptor superfamily member 1B-like isoform X1 n=1 Tax=Hypanus sabinus TaxID=79690 RepID=UPI0028C46B29|nr:tumor necrosis factor receptor superfamily member 1B-like isoform X1 [Hypanus sabinus]